MKKLVLTGAALAMVIAAPAMAADLSFKGPVQPAAPAWSWTGLYVGVHVGSGWGTKEFTQFVPPAGGPATTDASHAVNGMLGGGQIGYNLQMGWAVLGAEIQASLANLKGQSGCGVGFTFNCSSQVTGLATFAGRLGVTSDQNLFYVKAGAAWTHDKYGFGTAISDPTIQPSSASDGRWGWMFGTGIERAVTANISAKIEYNYLDFGTTNYLFSSTLASPVQTAGLYDTFDITQRIHLIKFGLNYRF